MSVTGLTRANGSDLLSLLSASHGQEPATVTARADVLNKAILVAQASEPELVAEIENIGKRLGVFA
jgi:hypothetical protein